MPIDHKRINGPEITIPYQLFEKLNTQSLKSQFDQEISNGTRKDGRKLDEHRKIFLKTDVVNQAKGSAYIEMGQTKVIVSVFDPREIPNKTDYSPKGEIYCEFKFAPFSCRKRRLHQQDSEEIQYSAIMKQALESVVFRHEFPNFQVDIYALCLHNDGSVLSAAITAAGVALAQAGIPLYDLVTSLTVGVQGDTVLVDPTLNEENLCGVSIGGQDNHGTVLLSFLNTQEQISQFYQSGHLSLESVKICVDALIKTTKSLIPLIQKCLVEYVVKSMDLPVED